MKRSLKKFSCVLIAVVMMFSSIPSFAFDIDGTEYVYAGELSNGYNSFFENTPWEERNDEVDFYCSFTAENDGYYGFGFGHMHCGIIGDVYADDELKTKQEYEYQNYDEEHYHEVQLYYLTAGEYYFAGKSYCKRDTHLTFESLGESMTAVSFYNELIYDYDFYKYQFSGYYTKTETKIDFSSGKSFGIGKTAIKCELESRFKEGENKATFEFLGKSLPSVMTIYKIDHYISDVEISNVEKYLESVVLYYNYRDYEYPDGETATITFTDGSTDSFVIDEWYGNYVMFPNGSLYECYIDFEYFGAFDKGNMIVSIGDAVIKEYEHNGRKVSFAENAKGFARAIKEIADKTEEAFNMAYETFDWNDISGTTLDALGYIIIAFACQTAVSIEIWDFAMFYITYLF